MHLKVDGLNPTGSFKDRGMTMAVSKAKEAGATAVICASTGNTSAAAAAYARRGGMRAFVLIPDWLCIPMGNAGNISAYWMGFKEYKNAGRCRTLPRMMGFQAAGSAPLVHGTTVEQPDTIATAIRIGNPANREKALKVREESNGGFSAVSDQEILNAYRFLGREEGVFCEPASAASVAGLLQRAEEVPSGARVVCVLTGNGLKDPTTAIDHSEATFHGDLDPNTETVAKVLGF